jgi:class 3 adenylate cyclase
MMASDISLALNDGKSARTIASEFAEELMADPKLLKTELQGDGPLTRKPFCEFLGIGESTLTGWLQADRFPQAAAVAYVLLLTARELQERVGKLEKKQREPRVIAFGGRYAVVAFEEASDDGHIIGRIIASDITELGAARQIAFSQSSDMLRLVTRQLELVDDLIELTEQAGNDTQLRMADHKAERTELQRLKLLMTDFDRWAEAEKPSSRP